MTRTRELNRTRTRTRTRTNATRWFMLLSLMVIGTLVLSACGGGGGGDNDDDPTVTIGASGSTATSDSTATPAAEAATPTGAAAGADATTAATTPAAATEPAAATTAATTAATAASTATGTEPAEATVEPVDPNAFAYGFNVAWRADAEAAEFNQQTRDTVADAGFNWVRIQIYWRDVQREPEWWDPLPIDNLLAQYEGSNVRVLASVSNPPDWAKDPTGNSMLADYAHWKQFTAFLAERYRGKIAAYEIWNEQNLASTVLGNVRVSDYAELLKQGYEGIKLADPDALVVFGGLTPTGVNDPAIAINDVTYLRDFYALDGGAFAQYFDVLGVHANATNHPPDLLYPDNPGEGGWSQDASFYFRRVEQLHAVMQEVGDDRPVWITEAGWTTTNEAEGYEYGADNTEEEQAQYLVDAFALAQSDWEWCTGMFVWNLNFSVVTEPGDEKHPWSVLYHDWSPRPAYTALQEMPKSE